jgi:hypothetical protein
MKRVRMLPKSILCAVAMVFIGQHLPAHCNTMEGPVVKAAKQALMKGDVTPVLCWIKKEYEDEVQAAFAKTLAVRVKGKQAEEFADTYFFKTVARLHRACEGEPYAGLKPSGAYVEPAVEMADQALETGDVKVLSHFLVTEGEEGLSLRFHRALEAKKDADASVEAGRKVIDL